MRSLALLAAPLLLLAAACGGTVVFEEDGAGGGGDGGAGQTSGYATPSSSITSVGVSVSSATAGGAPSTSIVASSGAGGAPGSVLPTVAKVNLAANCKPEVGPDPIVGSVVVSYFNEGGQPGRLDVTYSSAVFASEVEGWSFPLVFDPVSSGVVEAGQTVEIEHVKVFTEGDSSFVCSLCSFPGTVVMNFVAPDGTELNAFADFSLACAL